MLDKRKLTISSSLNKDIIIYFVLLIVVLVVSHFGFEGETLHRFLVIAYLLPWIDCIV